jgi:nicotinamidase/pyrazinamidase
MITAEGGDALVIVDLQKEFLPGGTLVVPQAEQIIPAINRVMAVFASRALPVFASRDWHPPLHCSFIGQGGPWPPHCIAGSNGARFSPELALPQHTVVISKATGVDVEAYSAFDGTPLQAMLDQAGVRRLFVAGIATEHCVLATVRDALGLGYQVVLLSDAIRALTPRAGQDAIDAMTALGAVTKPSDALA